MGNWVVEPSLRAGFIVPDNDCREVIDLENALNSSGHVTDEYGGKFWCMWWRSEAFKTGQVEDLTELIN